jgi:uncharacterized protein involved in exopolysaccharide biosynthesis
MAESDRAGWQPETDVDYGQRLVGFLLLKHKWLILGVAFCAGVVAFLISLFMPPTYRSDGSIVIDKALSASSSLLTGMLGPMGGGNTELESEKQVLISRELATQVMDELGLRIEIIDPLSPDAPASRLLRYLHLRKKSKFSREEVYNKLRLEGVEVNSELQNKTDIILHTAKDGSVSIDGKHFAAGQRVETNEVSFTPVFGAAHVQGQSYKLAVLPTGKAFLEWRNHLGVSPVNDKANVLRLSFSYNNPFICQRVVELVTEKYFSRYTSKSTENYDGLLDYIGKEIEKTRAGSDDLTNELTSYREAHKAYAPTAQGEATITRIGDLSATLTENRIQQQLIESALGSMKTRSPREVYDYIQAPASRLSLESALMMSLAEQLNALTQARLTKTEAHPDVKRINASIAITIKQISDSLRSNLGQLKATDKEITRNIEEMKSTLTGLPEAEGKVALLMAELDANAEIMKVLATSEEQTRLKRASTSTDIQRLDPPVVADKPESPRPVFNAILGAVIGIVLAIFAALIIEAADARIRTLREIRLGLGLPVAGVLPGPVWRRRRWRPTQRDPELIKRLCGFLRCKGRVLGLVHPLGSTGGYDLAWGLAESASEAGKPALLIDADRLGDGLAAALDKSPAFGLSDVAQGLCELDKALVTLSEDRRLLTLGQAPLAKETLESTMALLRERFATVLVCLPTPTRWVDQELLAACADESLMTLPQQGIAREELQQALAGLRQRGIEPRGAIVTNYSPQRDVLGKRELRQVAVAAE